MSAIAIAIALAVTASGCASSGAPSPNDAGGVTAMKAGVFPLLQSATAFEAQQTGGFEREGLKVEIVQTAGGAQTVPAMLTGDFDVIYANYTTAILAAQRGLPVKIFCGNDVGADDHALIVKQDSRFQRLADLAGSRVAVNNLQNIGTIAISTILRDAGVDPTTVRFLELPFPDMQASLAAGNVDAIWQVEPFKASALAAGDRVLSPLFTGSAKDMPVAGWLTTQQFAQKNPDALAAFCRALDGSMRELQGNRERLVKLVPTFTKVPADVVERVSLPEWRSKVDAAQLQHMADLMLEFKVLSQPFTVSPVIIQSG